MNHQPTTTTTIRSNLGAPSFHSADGATAPPPLPPRAKRADPPPQAATS